MPLLAAVVDRAVRDLEIEEHRDDAAEYFAGPVFEAHALLLDLDVERLRQELIPRRGGRERDAPRDAAPARRVSFFPSEAA